MMLSVTLIPLTGRILPGFRQYTGTKTHLVTSSTAAFKCNIRQIWSRPKFNYNEAYFSFSKFSLEEDAVTGNRSLFAKEDLDSNEILLVTPYYNHVIYSSEQSKFCNTCHDSLRALGHNTPVLASKFVRSHLYCCEACRTRGERYDEAMAVSLRTIQKLDPDFYITHKDTIKCILFTLARVHVERRAQIKIPSIASSEESNDDTDLPRMGRPPVLKESSLTYEDYALLCKKDLSLLNPFISSQDRQKYLDIDSKMRTLLFDSPLMKLGIDPLDIMLRDAANSFELDKYDSHHSSPGEEEKVISSSGYATFPLASYFNHNCKPNCAISFDMAANIVVRTTKSVPEGSELTICYDAGSIASPVFGEEVQSERSLMRRCKKLCKEVWAFQCDCVM